MEMKRTKLPPQLQEKRLSKTAFSADEEDMLVSHVIALSMMGFPVRIMDLRSIASSYLLRAGKKIKVFKNGTLPGKDWALSFLKRHKEKISPRLVKNITTKRAAVGLQDIQAYFECIKGQMEGVPAENIWNYDETNLVDDPGCNAVLVKRGTKYPERIRNSTKSCTTLMVCGNAAGILAPLYINYKAESLYCEWTEGGPPKTRYNRSKSGWMDLRTFEDWFQGTMLPILKNLPGKKILIGDNLSSHLSYQVVTKCREVNTFFVCLPPNSSHLTQPLDVAVFRSMKGSWREILTNWKQTEFGKKCPTIPKSTFPKLVCKLMDKMKETVGNNLQSGFRTCGNFPFEPNNVIKKLSVIQLEAEVNNLKEYMSESFLQHLQEARKDTIGAPKKRGKKVNVPPGQGITPDDFPTDDGLQGTSKKQRKGGKKCHTKESMDSEEDGSSVSYMETDDEELPCWENYVEEQLQQDIASEEEAFESPTPQIAPRVFGKGDYVIVDYESSRYPGRILVEDGEDLKITCLTKAGKYWKWPTPADEIWYKTSDVVQKIPHPKPVSRTRKIYLVDMKR